jgi:hypothetical protein
VKSKDVGHMGMNLALVAYNRGVKFRYLIAILLSAGLTDAVSHAAAAAPEPAALQIGVAAVDITPTEFPVIVNGMFEERTADGAVDRLFARAFVLDDGATKIAIVVVDSCMLPRELLDAAKLRAASLTGIAADNMLIAATHTHSAPSAMGVLGSRADTRYPASLIPQLVRAIQLANERKQPARIGWIKVLAPNHTFNRRYIRRFDRIITDPFGEPTAKAHMNPGFLSPDVVGPSGPVDDELSVVAMQTLAGKPLGVLCNFSMHYVGSPLLSADYFGRFAENLGHEIDGGDGASSCVVAMSQGTSGDLISRNYDEPERKFDYDQYAAELAEIAAAAYRRIEYRTTALLAMREAKLTLNRRVPNAARLAWAREMAAKIGDRRPVGWPEVYALEQIILHDEPQRELKLQAVRIGDLGIAAIPNEVFAITGLKLKAQSPLPATFTIELANGGEGYIAPPEQHPLGGYTTWPARSAGLEVAAEPKIVETVLGLMEEVAGTPRKPLQNERSAYDEAVLESKPRAYWPLAEIGGDVAEDISGHQHNAHYEDKIARYLPGPPGDGLGSAVQIGRAAHFAGGRLHAQLPGIGDRYTVEFWFWNGLPADARPITGYLFSRGPNGDLAARGDHIGIGGTSAAGGKLFVFNGNTLNHVCSGQAAIGTRTWNHVVLVRDGHKVFVYLNGNKMPEVDDTLSPDAQAAGADWFFGGRNDNFCNLEGKLAKIAIFDRALAADEINAHFKSAGVLHSP